MNDQWGGFVHGHLQLLTAFCFQIDGRLDRSSAHIALVSIRILELSGRLSGCSRVIPIYASS